MQAEQRPRAKLQRKCACGGKCHDCKSGGEEEQGTASRVLVAAALGRQRRGRGSARRIRAAPGRRLGAPSSSRRAEPAGPVAAEQDSAAGRRLAARGTRRRARRPSGDPGAADPGIAGLGGGRRRRPGAARGGTARGLAEAGPTGFLPGDLHRLRAGTGEGGRGATPHGRRSPGIIVAGVTLGTTTLSSGSRISTTATRRFRGRAGRSPARARSPTASATTTRPPRRRRRSSRRPPRSSPGRRSRSCPRRARPRSCRSTSVIDPATLHSRLNTKRTQWASTTTARRPRSPATSPAGSAQGGGPGGGGTLNDDTRDASGFLEVTRDAAGTSVTIKPKLTFKSTTPSTSARGTRRPGRQGITVPMSILEATENRFGKVYAADVPLDVEHPGPGALGGPSRCRSRRRRRPRRCRTTSSRRPGRRRRPARCSASAPARA